MKNLPELLRELAQLDAQIAAARASERPYALMQAKALIDAYDFSALELGLIKTQHLPPGRKGASTFPRKAVRQPAPPKYQDPKTGATWSGRGRQPLWMTDERDEYLLKA